MAKDDYDDALGTVQEDLEDLFPDDYTEDDIESNVF